MYGDSVIQEWLEEHGNATSFTFVVFGILKQEDVDLLIKGVICAFEHRNLHHKMAVFYDYIDEEQAVAWNTYQGTSLVFIFAGDMLDAEEQLVSLVQDGLKFLRFKNEYLGNYKCDSYV